MQVYFDHNVVVFVFECLRVVECRVIVFHDDGFPFESVPQTISYWGHSSFPDCSGSFSTSISCILCRGCHGAFRFAGCQLLVFGLNGFGWSCLVQTSARCPGCAHFRHNLSRMRLRNSSGGMFNLGRLLNASKSIASPPWVVVLGW